MVDEMLTSEQNELPTNTDTANLSAIEIGENFLTDAKAAGGDKRVISVPIAQLATLGTAVSSIIPPISKLTQAATTNGNEVLYRLVNAGVDGTLKKASNGDLWGALRVSGGKSKMARFQAVAGTASTQIPPIDPVTVMMAVALFTIEQKLDKIEEIGKQIMSFLEIEKESEIEADLETLFSVLAKYKHGWDNEHYIAGNYKLVLDIQRTARKHMNSYQKKVTDVLNTKKLFVSQSKINGILNDLLKKFKYYRLSLYTFSMSYFIEIMLSGDLREESFVCAKEEIQKISLTYRELFSQCSVYLEKLGGAVIETNILKGIGVASKAVGKFIENIPVVNEGQVDEYLQNKGSIISSTAELQEGNIVKAFAETSNPGVSVFVEKIDQMILIYGHTQEIYIDENNIHLVTA